MAAATPGCHVQNLPGHYGMPNPLRSVLCDDTPLPCGVWRVGGSWAGRSRSTRLDDMAGGVARLCNSDKTGSHSMPPSGSAKSRHKMGAASECTHPTDSTKAPIHRVGPSDSCPRSPPAASVTDAARSASLDSGGCSGEMRWQQESNPIQRRYVLQALILCGAFFCRQ